MIVRELRSRKMINYRLMTNEREERLIWLNDQVYFLKMISIDRRGNVWLIVPKNSMLNGVV